MLHRSALQHVYVICVTLNHFKLQHVASSHFLTLCHARIRNTTFRCLMLHCFITSHFRLHPCFILHHITLSHVTSHHIMLHHYISCHTALCNKCAVTLVCVSIFARNCPTASRRCIPSTLQNLSHGQSFYHEQIEMIHSAFPLSEDQSEMPRYLYQKWRKVQGQVRLVSNVEIRLVLCILCLLPCN